MAPPHDGHVSMLGWQSATLVILGERMLLVIDGDNATSDDLRGVLTAAGFRVATASTGAAGLAQIAAPTAPWVVITEMRLPDMSGLELLRAVRLSGTGIPVVLTTRTPSVKDTVAAMRSGAATLLEKPVSSEELLSEIEHVLHGGQAASRPLDTAAGDSEPHAATRWARALVPTMDSPKDPRTIAVWGRWVAVSPGALRSWCRTAGIPPRHSLVFARILRAISRSDGGRQKLENLLDVVDRRTLDGLLWLAGFAGPHDVPKTIDEYLRRQRLVRDPEALLQISRALAQRQQGFKSASVWQRRS